MKTLLLTVVLLGLVAALLAQDPLSAAPKDPDILGTWYMKAAVTNKTLPEWKKPKTAFPMTMTAVEGGKIEGRMTLLINGQCHEKRVMMAKTDEPGKYSASMNVDELYSVPPAVEGKRLIYVEELPVKDHYIFYCEDQRRGKTFGMGKLVGRTPEPNPEALEEFKKFAQRKQIPEKNIVITEQRETCISEQD